jgi:hypothetical protein
MATPIPADVLQIDVQRDDFDRRQELFNVDPSKDPLSPARALDPSLEYVLSIANDWLVRLRVVSRTGSYRPLDLAQAFMLVIFVNDDGTQLEPMPGLHRRIVWSPKTWTILGIDQRVWRAVDSLGWGHHALPAQVTLLDAFGLLPDVGPAVVLADIALEVRIAEVLDASVPSTGSSPALWQWITSRQPFFQQPSVKEEFDILLKALTGRSLKDRSDLWEAFGNLRDARNSYVHGGTPSIGKGASASVVTVSRAQELLLKAQAIMDWLDSLPYLKRTASHFQSGMTFGIRTTLLRVSPPIDASPESASPPAATASE